MQVLGLDRSESLLPFFPPSSSFHPSVSRCPPRFNGTSSQLTTILPVRGYQTFSEFPVIYKWYYDLSLSQNWYGLFIQ